MKQVGIPLILTLKLDPKSQAQLDTWRTQFFPPDRNFLKAHLTIYHQLPGQRMQGIVGLLENYVAFLSPGAVFFSGLITRGGFVGVAVESVDLHRMRADLDELLASDLRAQDKKTYKPHVTITNLGSPGHALSCFKALETLFVPWQGEAIGLELFHYRRGHWQFAHDFPFRGLLPSPE